MFNSKILLFGEYSVIKSGRALAIPFNKYQGAIKFDSSYSDQFMDFHNYLSNSSILSSLLNLDRFMEDIKGGMFFASNIPQGMGVGSSGALCAALYKRYLNGAYDVDKKGLSSLMDHMSLMESFYHGSSSGLDPLISLINRPLVVQNRNQLTLPDSITYNDLYLFNTNHSRKTSPLVMHYLEMCERPKFIKDNKVLLEINDALIDCYLNNNLEMIEDWFYKLSKWQYIHFSKMIHESVSQLWLEGLESKKYFFKLCGAGGGGHYIVYSKNKDDIPFKDALLSLF